MQLVLDKKFQNVLYKRLFFLNSDTNIYEDYVTVEIKYCDCLLNKKTIIPES